ncbi:LPXTG cell wall anchor domain-containing protein [Enterococcus sp. AZ154]|uniref:LPXTG cell wall anchor domain-containing protein n=1 Tax=Enterococcus sp. AZ154 TaxID=2774683 RepID=UPI003D2B36E6
MKKLSVFVLLSIFSLYLIIKPLAVEASHFSSIPVKGNLDKTEQTTSEKTKEKEKLIEKQTIIKETSLPKTGENVDDKIFILGCLVTGITMIVILYKQKKTTT